SPLWSPVAHISTPFFSLFLPRPPASPLFPYTTLFRSGLLRAEARVRTARRDRTRLAVRHAPGRLQHARASRRLLHRRALGKANRSEEHTSELQSLTNLVCRLLLEKKKRTTARVDQ